MAIKTRKPTGKPPWPIVLIAGGEKTGKSYSAAQASASSHIGRTFWIGVGEDDPDEYGSLPGADFEIVEHDGTFRGILNALNDAISEPPTDGKPNLVVLDSATRLWELIVDNAQKTANERRKTSGGADAPIGMDLWNKAKNQWNAAMTIMRAHRGPVIITSRFEQVTMMENGKPTMNKEWKIKAEKSLPYDVGVVVEMPKRGEVVLTSVRSIRFNAAPDAKTPYPNFTLERLWNDLGVTEPGGTTDRVHAEVIATPPTIDMATPAQRQAIAAALGTTDKGEILAALSATLGREVTSGTDLTAVEATTVIESLAEVAA